MNPLTNVKNITKLSEVELKRGTTEKKSWHDMYKDSAWIFIGGLPYDLTEGDIITVFSQVGEIANINLIRDKKTGKSKGYCFMCYVNQKSTVLAVDNLNGIKLCNRTIRVDHVADYKPPKEREDDDELTKKLHAEGCAPVSIKTEDSSAAAKKHSSKKVKKEKKKKKKKKKRKRYSSSSSGSSSERDFEDVKVKQEKADPGYEKYDHAGNNTESQVEVKGSSRLRSSSHDRDLPTVIPYNKMGSRLDKESRGNETQAYKRLHYSPDAQNVRNWDRSSTGNVKKESDIHEGGHQNRQQRHVNDECMDGRKWKHNSQTRNKTDVKNDNRKSEYRSSNASSHHKAAERSRTVYTDAYEEHSAENERDYSSKYTSRDDRKETSTCGSRYGRHDKEHHGKESEESQSRYDKRDSHYGKEKDWRKDKYDSGKKDTQKHWDHNSQKSYSSSSSTHKER